MIIVQKEFSLGSSSNSIQDKRRKGAVPEETTDMQNL